MSTPTQPTHHEPTSAKPAVTPTRRRWRAGRWLCLGCLLAAFLVAFLPTLIARTPLRNYLLSRALADEGYHGHVATAELGWTRPFAVDGLFIARDDRRLRIDIESAGLQYGALGLIQRWPSVGTIRLKSPTIDFVVSPDLGKPETTEDTEDRTSRRSTKLWTAKVVIEDAHLLLRDRDSASPMIELQDVDVTARIHRPELDRVLEVDPVMLLDREPLRPELFGRGLQFVAPILARSTSVAGLGSLELTEFRLPLESLDDEQLARQLKVRGRFAVEELEASLADPALLKVAEKLAGLLRLDLPQTMRIVDTDVEFEMREGRVYHDGLTFFIPEISPDLQWQTRGSVGLDETLDLEIEARVPFSLLGDGPLFTELTATPIQVRVVGTLDDPQVRLPEDASWLNAWSRSLVTRALPEERQDLGNNVLNIVEGLLQGSEPESELELAPLLEAVLERRAARQPERAASSAEEPTDPEIGRGALLRRLLGRSAADNDTAAPNSPPEDSPRPSQPADAP